MINNIEYVTVGEQDIDSISFLWEKLKNHHITVAPFHSKYFSSMTWNVRKQLLLDKITEGHLLVDGARDTVTGKIIGYCISSVYSDKLGEINSIYIEKEYRRQGIGDNFMKKAMNWMDGIGVSKRIIGVATGNEDVLPFYARYGFYSRSIILNRTEEV